MLSVHFFLFYLPIAFSPQTGFCLGYKPSLLIERAGSPFAFSRLLLSGRPL